MFRYWLPLITILISQMSIFAQENTEYGTLFMHCKKGGFKILKSEGKIRIQGCGTLLINRLKGEIKSSGFIKEHQVGKREVYSGKGTITIEGEFRALQWDGKDFNATWRGKGRARISSQLDRVVKDSWFRFGGTKKKYPWQSTIGYKIKLPFIEKTESGS